MTPAYGHGGDALDDLAAPMIVKVGGGVSMLTGAFTLGLAAQTMLVFRMRGWIGGVVLVMVLLGISAVVTGWGTTRGQARSAIVAGLSIGPARKVTAARDHLRAQGLDFGM